MRPEQGYMTSEAQGWEEEEPYNGRKSTRPRWTKRPVGMASRKGRKSGRYSQSSLILRYCADHNDLQSDSARTAVCARVLGTSSSSLTDSPTSALRLDPDLRTPFELGSSLRRVSFSTPGSGAEAGVVDLDFALCSRAGASISWLSSLLRVSLPDPKAELGLACRPALPSRRLR